MKLLIWKDKHGNWYWAAEKDKLDLAFLEMFKKIDESGYYTEFEGDQKQAYEEAKEGKAKSAKWLIQLRTDYEYEGYDVEEATLIM
jgi:hypothetical protein